MKLQIAHLYYDLMNLYGESGNPQAIVKHLKEKNIDSEIHFLTVDDKIDFNKYDIFYIGMGTLENQKIVLKNILQYKDDIKKAIDAGKLFIATGSALELFGKKIKDGNQNIKCLNIFDFETETVDLKIVGEQHFQTKIIDKDVIGFQNRSSIIKKNKNHLFKVISGTGSSINDEYEGFVYKNFYGTYLTGPLLIRNPYLTDKLLNNYLDQINVKYKDNKKDFIDYKAYDVYLQNFIQEKNTSAN